MPRSKPLTDDELVALSKGGAWENAGCAVACLAGIATAVAIVVSNIRDFDFGWVALLAGLIILPVALFVGLVVALVLGVLMVGTNRRGQPYLAELMRRHYSASDIEQGIWIGKTAMQEPSGPDWVLLLSGSALPHGGGYAVRVTLKESPTLSGHIWVTYRPFLFDIGQHEPFEEFRKRFVDVEADLDQQACARLLALCRQDPPPIVPRCGHVKDGFPCEVVLLRRGSPGEVRARCNIAGVLEPQETIAEVLLELASSASGGAPTGIWGACDAYGNITLSEIGPPPPPE